MAKHQKRPAGTYPKRTYLESRHRLKEGKERILDQLPRSKRYKQVSLGTVAVERGVSDGLFTASENLAVTSCAMIPSASILGAGGVSGSEACPRDNLAMSGVQDQPKASVVEAGVRTYRQEPHARPFYRELGFWNMQGHRMR